jgi:hypothetical protein
MKRNLLLPVSLTLTALCLVLRAHKCSLICFGLVFVFGAFSGFLVCEGCYVVCQFRSSYLVGYYGYGENA